MLTERDEKVLEFEGSWWLYPGPKDRAIRDYLDMSATRYYQCLRRLADDDEARQRAPLVIGRLRRMHRDRLARAAERLREGDSHG